MKEIPDDKKYFRIGEVSRIIGVEPYVLRYWEHEFPQIKPQRADTNQRTYQKKDVEILLEIKRLLYEEKLTIEGARKRLRQKKALGDQPTFLSGLKQELTDILKELS